MNDKIVIKGAKEHNLKNINIEIPRDKLVVITGLSGSGKSSLAFDTLYAEGQRRYVESLSSYARQFLGLMEKPNVESIEGLSPAISIDQKTTSKNPRSTVGTVTEIYDYIRLLYARIGVPYCPNCGTKIEKQSIDQIIDNIMELDEGTKIQVLAPVVRGRKGEFVKQLEGYQKEGFVRARVDGEIYELGEDEIIIDKNKKHEIELVVDRLVIKPDIVTRLTESVETALNVAREGLVLLKNENNILPINPQKYKHIIVTGKNAHGYVHGGGSGAVVPFHYTNLFDGIQKEGKLNNVKVEYIDELDFMPSIMYTDDNLNEKGFHAEYFKNIHFEGAPVVKQTEKKINYSWAAGTELEGMPKDYFSVKWYSTMCVDETADYEFTLGGDDGYKLFINDQPIIDDWTPGGFRTTNVTKTLKAGEKYHVRVEYYQQGGGAGICFLWKRKNETQNKFADYLNKADLVIACFGHSSDTEGEASDRTFELPEVDKKMLASLSGCKKPVIGIVNAGGNIEMQKWEPSLKGLIWGFYGGQEAGTAIGEALFGKVNPSGKLPMTFEKKWEDSPAYNSYHDPDKDKHVAYTEGIFIGYRGYDKLKREVQYPFGYGLSYTTFKLSNIVVSKPNADGTVEVTCRLANTGKRDGAQVIQAYVGKAENSPVERPQKELRKFEKIFLKAGESTTVKMTLPKESFMYFDVNRTQFVTDPGIYNIMLGFSSRDIKAQKNIQYTL